MKNYFENVINYSRLSTKKCLEQIEVFQINIKLNLLSVFFGFNISLILIIKRIGQYLSIYKLHNNSIF